MGRRTGRVAAPRGSPRRHRDAHREAAPQPTRPRGAIAAREACSAYQHQPRSRVRRPTREGEFDVPGAASRSELLDIPSS
jgi:hypothetical protein